ncbi:MAG: hypothetical protein ACFB4I_11285 [Cyanophyceae cyanobacterium]
MFKLKICYLVSLILVCVSCSNLKHERTNSTERDLSTEKEKCPEKQNFSLSSRNVKMIELNEQPTQESGIAHKSKPIAYAFKAQKRQKLDNQVNKDICVLIYTPESKALQSSILPQTGSYIIQISAIKASTTFDIEMSLNNTQPLPTAESNYLPSQAAQHNTNSNNSYSPQPEKTSLNRSTAVTQSEAIGWIWIGAVNNTSGTFSYNEPLIPTKSQPVSITPSIVPVPGEVVTLKTGVNLRRNVPQPPNFKLAEKASNPLKTGQQVEINRIEAFVDTNSDVEKTRIWAEVSFP